MPFSLAIAYANGIQNLPSTTEDINIDKAIIFIHDYIKGKHVSE